MGWGGGGSNVVVACVSGVNVAKDCQGALDSVMAFTVKLGEQNLIASRLPDGTRFMSLFDSGSSKTLVSVFLVKKSPFLQSLPVVKIDKVIEMVVGNGKSVFVNLFLEFVVTFGQAKVPLRAYILPTPGPIDLVLGMDVQAEYKAVFDAAKCTLQLTLKDVLVVVEHAVICPPEKTTSVPVKINEYTTCFYGSFEVKFGSFFAEYACPRAILEFEAGKSTIKIVNESEHSVEFPDAYVVGEIVMDYSEYPMCNLEVDKPEKALSIIQRQSQSSVETNLVIVDKGIDVLNGQSLTTNVNELEPQERKI